MEPILLKPVGKDYLWGGTRLKSEYGKNIDLDPLAETWECSVHPDGSSMVAAGRYKDMALDVLLKEHPEWCGTKAGGELPILIKFIDAEKDLSVQVHPGDDYARIHEGQNGKSELWYVLDAKPGAELICGFAHDMTPDILKEAIQTGTLTKHLQRVPVRKGNVLYIPSGTVHAIGAGTLIAEIQECSNVTYRVYDYDRVDKNGQKRPLHFEKAVQVLNMKAGTNVRQKPRKVNYYKGSAEERLCRCKYFEVNRILVNLGFCFDVTESSFQVLLCLNGEGAISFGEKRKTLRFGKGDCVFIPAGAGYTLVLGNAELLKVRC